MHERRKHFSLKVFYKQSGTKRNNKNCFAYREEENWHLFFSFALKTLRAKYLTIITSASLSPYLL
jgi:hypothetical protein